MKIVQRLRYFHADLRDFRIGPAAKRQSRVQGLAGDALDRDVRLLCRPRRIWERAAPSGGACIICSPFSETRPPGRCLRRSSAPHRYRRGHAGRRDAPHRRHAALMRHFLEPETVECNGLAISDAIEVPGVGGCARHRDMADAAVTRFTVAAVAEVVRGHRIPADHRYRRGRPGRRGRGHRRRGDGPPPPRPVGIAGALWTTMLGLACLVASLSLRGSPRPGTGTPSAPPSRLLSA